MIALRRAFALARPAPALRALSAAPAGSPEARMEQVLREQLEATAVEVEDMSGGCGSMYRIDVESGQFAGIPLVKQHRLVTDTLKAEIQAMHGLTINTRVPV